ncbi:helix-turn-helix transcriptional regulator [Paenibacillus eucommiae]|uniref:AraC-like DNA-binding protein n=1 Tax=Paenibacillus eucommiae TaxID=1355755 RepID=A0ABS4J4U8_9BACL|nr:AraC family transcriptional regulator [Paenibacillus eucommiae]MBP1994866.1 AraC-like DNA-binding protein [Paenibacillus eucommiae]
MAFPYEELAQQFAVVPIDVYGVYRKTLEANLIYGGHVKQPTTKCAILIGLSGQADFLFNETDRYRLEPGKVLVGGVHKQLEIHVSSSGFEYGLVHFLPVYAEKDAEQRLTEVSMLHAALDPEVLRLLERLLHASSSPDSMGMLEKKALFYRLLNKLLLSERLGQNKESYLLMDEAISYIQTHHMETLTLDILAERYKMKAKYFSYLFHKYVGMAPIDYLIQYRMNRAEELLVTGQFPVSVVAKSVGYPDAYYFSRLYKKHKGLSPGKVSLHLR